jgi:hypothetical protein
MVKLLRVLAVLAMSCLGAPGPGRAQQAIPVDLQLVLAVDSSGSINADEFRLQMEGLTAAFRNSAILEAIRRGPIGAIAVTLIEWSSVDQQHQSVAWTMISDEESMALFADQLAVTPRYIPGGSTSVSDALKYSGLMFAKSGFASERRVIDVSGDGSNNSGIPPDSVRDRLVDQGVVINGLAILNDEPNLKEYYAASVIGGPGAFVLVAESYETFSHAILNKLIQEIVAVPAPIRVAMEVPYS